MRYALRDVYAFINGIRTLVAVRGQPVEDQFARYVDEDETTGDQDEAIASTLGPAELPGEDLASGMSARHASPQDSEPVGTPAGSSESVEPPAPPAPSGVEFYDEDATAEAQLLSVTAEECTPDDDGDVTTDEVREAYFAKTDRDDLFTMATRIGVTDLAGDPDADRLKEAIADRLEQLSEVDTTPAKPYSEMDKAELIAELERRGIEVPKGRPKNEDLVKLLEEHPAE